MHVTTFDTSTMNKSDTAFEGRSSLSVLTNFYKKEVVRRQELASSSCHDPMHTDKDPLSPSKKLVSTFKTHQNVTAIQTERGPVLNNPSMLSKQKSLPLKKRAIVFGHETEERTGNAIHSHDRILANGGDGRKAEGSARIQSAKKRLAKDLLPRTCDVLYERDEYGNFCNADGRESDLGSGHHSVVDGHKQNPLGVVQALEQEQSQPTKPLALQCLEPTSLSAHENVAGIGSSSIWSDEAKTSNFWSESNSRFDSQQASDETKEKDKANNGTFFAVPSVETTTAGRAIVADSNEPPPGAEPINPLDNWVPMTFMTKKPTAVIGLTSVPTLVVPNSMKRPSSSSQHQGDKSTSSSSISTVPKKRKRLARIEKGKKKMPPYEKDATKPTDIQSSRSSNESQSARNLKRNLKCDDDMWMNDEVQGLVETTELPYITTMPNGENPWTHLWKPGAPPFEMKAIFSQERRAHDFV